MHVDVIGTIRIKDRHWSQPGVEDCDSIDVLGMGPKTMQRTTGPRTRLWAPREPRILVWDLPSSADRQTRCQYEQCSTVDLDRELVEDAPSTSLHPGVERGLVLGWHAGELPAGVGRQRGGPCGM